MVITKKELLEKFPDLITYKRLQFNNSSQFKDFEKKNWQLLGKIHYIMNDVRYIPYLRKYLDGLREEASSGLRFVLMYKGKELIGIMEGHTKSKNKFYINNIAIKKEERNKGYGTSLVARVLAELHHDGYKEVNAMAFKDLGKINMQLTGNQKFKDGKIRKFNGKVEYELPYAPTCKDTIKIKKLTKAHAK